MGKKKATVRDGSCGAFNGGLPSTDASSAGYDSAPEAGLCVCRQKGGVAYLSGMTAAVALLTIVQLALTPSLPKLLCHWVWVVLTTFGAALTAFRWLNYEEAATYLVFWGLLMVHGLVWLPALMVPTSGVLPGALLHAYGEHGGAHIGIASLGSVLLLLTPPLLLLAFMWLEREHLVVIYHDFHYAMDGMLINLVYQLLCPTIPFYFWGSVFRPMLFSDMPEWPAAPVVVVAGALANLPVMIYAYHSTRLFRGPAHWFLGGSIVWTADARGGMVGKI